MGIVIDEFGNKISEDDNEANFNNKKIGQSNNFENMMFKRKDNNDNQSQKPQKKFNPINSYKPQGSLIYNEDLLNSLENKFI